MNTAIVLLSAVPVRKEPSHRSEMVSQLLFGEYAETFEVSDHFTSVRSLHDGYEGWIQTKQLVTLDKSQILTTSRYIGSAGAEIFINGVGRKFPFGTPVYTGEAGDTVSIGSAELRYSLTEKPWDSRLQKLSESALQEISRVYLNTPYLWGGRSVYGIDCSGFAQQVFKMFGISLQRDAYQQATQGNLVENIADARPGDLAFFDNEQGRITHVGIVLGNHRIIHASGQVQIDQLTEHGIIHALHGEQTHQLHSIRRYV